MTAAIRIERPEADVRAFKPPNFDLDDAARFMGDILNMLPINLMAAFCIGFMHGPLLGSSD